MPQDCPAMVDAKKRLAGKETAEEPEPRPDIQNLRNILRDLEAAATVPVDQCPDCISMRKRIEEACKARDAKKPPLRRAQEAQRVVDKHRKSLAIHKEKLAKATSQRTGRVGRATAGRPNGRY